MENLPTGEIRAARFEPMVHGLRGVAATSVYLFHVYDMMRKQGIFDPTGIASAVKASIVALSCGVELFFMISGYLIMGSLVRHANIGKFFIDRVARLYPLFLVLHVALFVVAPLIHYKWTVGLTPAQWAFHFTTNLLMLPGVFKLPLMQLNAWTLSYEWVFYILSATAFFAYSRKLNWLKAVLVLVIPVLLFIYPRSIFFLAGVIVYFANTRKLELPKFLSNPAVVLLVPFIFAGMMGYSNHNHAPLVTYFAFLPGLILFALITRRTPVYRTVLEARPVQFMGTISYSFYLLHPIVTAPLKVLATKVLDEKLQLPPAVTVAIFGSVAFVATTVLSYVSYQVLEKRGTRWLKAFLQGERPSLIVPIRTRLVKLMRQR